MAKRSRANRKQQGAKRANSGKSQPRSYSRLHQDEGHQQSDVSQPAASQVATLEIGSRPASKSASKPAAKGKTPNIQRRGVNWKEEYANVTDDLHLLMIVSIFLFIVIIGAGSFMV